MPAGLYDFRALKLLEEDYAKCSSYTCFFVEVYFYHNYIRLYFCNNQNDLPGYTQYECTEKPYGTEKLCLS